jgi:hypothetical protein
MANFNVVCAQNFFSFFVKDDEADFASECYPSGTQKFPLLFTLL